MKSTIISSLFCLLIGWGVSVAQVTETGETSLEVEALEETPEPVKVDTVKKPFKRIKAGGVSAVVGEYVIVEFDIDLGFIELQQQGASIEDISRCQMLGKLMEDKLYSHHAKQDSIIIPDSQTNSRTDQQLQYLTAQLGTQEKVLEYYKKDNLEDLRKELFDVNQQIALAQEMQRTITDEVEITPEEIRNFFYSIPEDERPVFGAEVEVAQIIVDPEVTEKAKEDAINRLNEIRTDIVEDGSSFSTKAVLYSKDEGSARKGGLIEGVRRDAPFAKEFKDMAFSLLEGEVSEPFETDFGFHILYVEKIRGQEVDVRHILLFPEVTQKTLDEAREKIDKIRESIVNDSLSFGDAARLYSDQKETRNSGGRLMNPITGDTRFDLTKMDPTLSAQVYNLAEGEVSKVFTDRDRTGKSSYKILSVTRRFEEHPADFVKDYEKIKDLALKEKQIKAIQKWQEKKIKETYISVNRDYTDCDFSNNWLQK
ncbi:peptidylprolyl isomerase [Aureitalea sp. L0-47]|uniref:peptidylprolyl isomerase n=1 Tax=Aureitalea sp. L0-47 TaxID=2816962 RepID=UPI002238F6A7|nr:peptidylprolyl isomerase [Aureitalea sp. L0-47]